MRRIVCTTTPNFSPASASFLKLSGTLASLTIGTHPPPSPNHHPHHTSHRHQCALTPFRGLQRKHVPRNALENAPSSLVITHPHPISSRPIPPPSFPTTSHQGLSRCTPVCRSSLLLPTRPSSNATLRSLGRPAVRLLPMEACDDNLG